MVCLEGLEQRFFTLTVGNALVPLQTSIGPVDAIDLSGHGVIVPLAVRGANEVDVLVAANQKAVISAIPALTKIAALRESQLTHPLYLDKWDRYCSRGVGESWRITPRTACARIRKDFLPRVDGAHRPESADFHGSHDG